MDERSRRLWNERLAVNKQAHVFAIMDAAANDGLIDALYSDAAPGFECLLAGELAPDMVYVAPYLVELAGQQAFANWALGGWGQHWGIFLTSGAELRELWRHFRSLTMVYDPDGVPIYFRFYDPRVLRIFLPTCNTDQVKEFFGPVDRFVLEGESPDEGVIFSHKDGELIEERFSI